MTEDQKKLVTEWYEALTLVAEAKQVIEKEQALRKQVIATCFPNPVEGTNHFELGDGYKITLSYKIDRKLDEAAFEAQKEILRTQFQLDPNSVIKYSPSLITTGFKTLKSTNEAAYTFMQQFVTEKPGSHSIELKPPKDSK